MCGIIRHVMSFAVLLALLPGTTQMPGILAREYSINEQPTQLALQQLADDFWDWKLEQFPEMATVLGFHHHDDKLESYAYGNFDIRRNTCQGFLDRALILNNSREWLSVEDGLTLDILIDQLQTYIEGYVWIDYGVLNPINFLEGIHIRVAWVNEGHFKNYSHYDHYLRRLNALPRQIEEIINLLERSVRLKRTNHASSMRDVITQLSLFCDVEYHRTPYYMPYLETLDKAPLSQELKLNIRTQGRIAIESRVQTAFRRLRDYISTRYIPMAREHEGVCSLDNGAAYYRSLLKWHLSLDIDPEDIHRLGLTEVTRIKKQMETVMHVLGYGDLNEFFQHLKIDREFFDHTEEELLLTFKHRVYQEIQPRLSVLFSNLTTIPNVSVIPMTYDGIAAQYVTNAMMVNTFRPHTRPYFSAMALCLHEAVPGHHLQLSIAKQLPLPHFRKNLWGGRKYSAPFHFPYYTAYVEGWALYAEYLGEELHLFSDPYELFGRYTYEIFRACRLVVDTGIHSLGWSRDTAIAYMTNYTFMPRDQVAVEVDRYITWPGQACAYKIGEIKIKQIRQKAFSVLGHRFDARDFHQRLLEVGPVPLSILEHHMDQWIQERHESGGADIRLSIASFLVLLSASFLTCIDCFSNLV